MVCDPAKNRADDEADTNTGIVSFIVSLGSNFLFLEVFPKDFASDP
jgi:hypothetical protein